MEDSKEDLVVDWLMKAHQLSNVGYWSRRAMRLLILSHVPFLRSQLGERKQSLGTCWDVDQTLLVVKD